ncbi:fumarylacetoacetate hydrolase family protein [Rhodococcus sp. WS4]|nr:fumarylacetoacetate hydrolase family protein [Rhodococcus sp. WS4]
MCMGPAAMDEYDEFVGQWWNPTRSSECRHHHAALCRVEPESLVLRQSNRAKHCRPRGRRRVKWQSQQSSPNVRIRTMIHIDYEREGEVMKLARLAVDNSVVVAEVLADGDYVVIGEGGQDLLLEAARCRGDMATDGTKVPRDRARVLAPVPRPPSIRDFFAFEQHMRASRASAGNEPDPGWYEQPYFYFTNPAAVLGPDEVVRPPRGTRALDYELEVAAVIGSEASDLDAADPRALDCVVGYTILNDWSARDIQGREMKQNIGPQKAKDFATSVGPWLVTPDELPFADPARPRGRMRASVNGELWSDGEMSDIYFPWSRLVSHASQDTALLPGDLLGSGTCGTGCVLELRGSGLRDTRHWLRENDVVELEVDGLGVLANRIGVSASS